MARKMTTMNENLKPKLKTVDPTELPEVLDVAGAAALLGVTPNSIYYMVEHKQIPARRAGKGYRFRKSVLLEWLAGEPLVAAGK
jgi:excisionase family DNA binding protein